MASTAIHAQVMDSLLTLTIFVAFVTVLFGIRYDPMVKGIKDELPDKQSKPIAHGRAKGDLRGLLWSKGLPLVALTAIPTYLFLPLAVRILGASSFGIWHFDTLETGFVFLEGYLITLLIWCAWLAFLVAMKGFKK
jgi:hypothetical protein